MVCDATGTMRFPVLLAVVTASAFSLAACVPTSGFKPSEVTGKATGDLAPGSRVGARQEGRLMLAEVTAVEGDQYVVKFANRATAKVKKADILPVAAPGTLKAGDRVLAPQQETNLWHADVLRVEGATVVVVFAGHTDETKVPADRVAHLPEGFCDPNAGCSGSGEHQKDANGGKGVAAPVEADPEKAFHKSLKLGDTVLAKAKEFGTSNHYEWRKATVSGRNGDALVVKLDDGSEPKNAFTGDLRPLRAPKRPIELGRRALWEDKPGRWVEIWVGQPPQEDGSIDANVTRSPNARGGDGGEMVKLTKDQVAKLTALEPADL